MALLIVMMAVMVVVDDDDWDVLPVRSSSIRVVCVDRVWVDDVDWDDDDYDDEATVTHDLGCLDLARDECSFLFVYEINIHLIKSHLKKK